jgi:hypothetical protein
MFCAKKLMNEKTALSKKLLNECMVICKIVRRVFFVNKLLMMMMMKISTVFLVKYIRADINYIRFFIHIRIVPVKILYGVHAFYRRGNNSPRHAFLIN